MRGRVVLCGAISTYNSDGPPPGPSNYLNLLVRRGRMEGFIIIDYLDRFPAAQMEMAGWIGEGKIKSVRAHRRGPRDGARRAEPVVQRRQHRQGDRRALTATLQ